VNTLDGEVKGKLVLATRNRGKIREMKELLQDLPLSVLTWEDVEGWPVAEEKGSTFEENALAKAREAARWTGMPSLADDSGLVVDALGGEPGVHSALYAGVHGDDVANIARLLREMEGVPSAERTARFVCVLALADPGGKTLLVRETCEGAVADRPRGRGGFGYDPVFIPHGETRTMAELSPEEKNALSHRGKALRRLRELLERGEPAWLFPRES
jgi:XTP/dITP diphosphohydrolase